jgi:sugar lactone lactonase YvrE
VLIADSGNNRIRRLDRDGTITTIAGGGFRSADDDNVPALEATLLFPLGVAVDHASNIYIADSGNHAIRRVDPAGTIATVAGAPEVAGFAGDGGPATSALLNFPVGVAVGRRGELLIADARNNCVRHVGSKGKITTVAGQGDAGFGDFSGDGGPATDALLNLPQAVLLDPDENLLIADSLNGRVRRVDTDRIITTIAGGGNDTPVDDAPATTVRLRLPTSLAFDRTAGVIVGDEGDHRVWRLTPTATVPPAPGT